jgi:uncharacterized protein YegL
MNDNSNSFDQFNLGLDFNNFDPDQIQVEETINCVFVVDVSPSIGSYVDDLNNGFNDFVQTMQQSHVHDRLFVSVVEFDENVRVRSGFQPIIGVPVTTFVPQGRGTALFDAVLAGIQNATAYRSNLESTGINVKTLVFIITDGEDNSSNSGADDKVNATLQTIKADEANAFSFTTILFGVGNSSSFERAQKRMGIEHLAKVGDTGKEIKKMISFISSSVSKSASGGNPVVNF